MNAKRIVRIILLVILAVLLIIQLIPNELPACSEPGEHDLILSSAVSEEVGAILRVSCYDCHSNETRYPWYSYVAPVSWLVGHDVEEGRHELNFSEWNTFDKKRMLKKLEEIEEEVEEGEMPMAIYTAVHGKAKLSEAQKTLLVAWARELRAGL